MGVAVEVGHAQQQPLEPFDGQLGALALAEADLTGVERTVAAAAELVDHPLDAPACGEREESEPRTDAWPGRGSSTRERGASFLRPGLQVARASP